ncbi:hypothetical protein Rhe02_06330 [Rhizocola hellebori]|uniref:Uncharacterized protein n=1 Tax=Rhizocola hellebori TaxID=1392758 RepID=A0A8J3Q2Q4_9ACTN|nr:hypothetical protein Rhe02_06330 [Rhizocola hellebori]
MIQHAFAVDQAVRFAGAFACLQLGVEGDLAARARKGAPKGDDGDVAIGRDLSWAAVPTTAAKARTANTATPGRLAEPPISRIASRKYPTGIATATTA